MRTEGNRNMMDNVIYDTEKIEIIKNQIHFYETAFNLCLAGTLLFALLTVFIYFFLHIGTVCSRLTGTYRSNEIIRIRENTMASGNHLKIYGKKQPIMYQCKEDITEPLYSQEETVLLENAETDLLVDENSFVIQENIFLGDSKNFIP